MKILWLKSELLHPVDKGGKIRTYHMLKHLAREHRVTYLSLVTGHEPADAYVRAREYCHRLVAVPWAAASRGSAAFYTDLARNCVSPLPYAVEKYRSAPMRQAIERELAGPSRYDVVVCDFLAPSVNLPDGLSVPTVLFQHNVEATIWQRHAETATGVRKAFFHTQYRKMQRYEQAACRRFDAVVAVSELDRDAIRGQYGVERCYDVPTGVDHEFFRPNSPQPTNSDIVFTGSMDWMPNEDGVLWFAEQVLPLVAREAPDVRFTVVGRSPTPRVLALPGVDARIVVTGRVDDIRPYVDRAAAFVVPLRVGGGTRLKIYEAMAMGRPVVSTTIGAEGLPLEPGRDILIADEPAELAASIVRVIKDRALAARVGASGRALVCERFGWDRAAHVFAGVCSLAVSRQQPTAAVAA